MKTTDDDNEKVFLPHHTSNNQYYEQLCFERGSIVKFCLGMTSYNTPAEYEPIPFGESWPEESKILDCLNYTDFWRRWRNTKI